MIIEKGEGRERGGRNVRWREGDTGRGREMDRER